MDEVEIYVYNCFPVISFARIKKNKLEFKSKHKQIHFQARIPVKDDAIPAVHVLIVALLLFYGNLNTDGQLAARIRIFKHFHLILAGFITY